MAVRHRGHSRYNTMLVGGQALIGDHGIMNINHHRGHRGLHSSTIHGQVPANLTGPDQRISRMPGRVFQKIVTCLSKPSPLNNDWRMVADKALELSQEDVDCIAYEYRDKGPMEGVLRKMHERKMTVGRLVAILCEIQRLDAVTILTDAGYPRDLVPENLAQEERTDVHENPTTNADSLLRTSLDGKQDFQDKTPNDISASPSVHD